MFKKHLLTTNLIKLNRLYEKITISLNVNHWIFLTTVLTGCLCYKPEVRPKKLPNATLGNSYFAKLVWFASGCRFPSITVYSFCVGLVTHYLQSFNYL